MSERKKHKPEPTQEEETAALLFMAFLYGEYLHWALIHPKAPYISPSDWIHAILGE